MSDTSGKQYVDARALKEVFQISKSFLLTGGLVAIFSFFLVFPVANRSVIAPLTLLVIIMTSLRISVNTRFLKLKNPSVPECIKWGRLFYLTTAVHGVIISVGYIVLITDSQPLYDAILFIFLVTMSAAGVAAYSWYKPAAAAYVTSLVVPFTIASFIQGSYIDYMLGIWGTLFTVVMIVLSRRVNTGLIRSMEIQKKLEDEVVHRIAAEKKACQLKDAAESASKIKGEFLANMSHEIRTPMNAIIGLSHLALKTPLSEQQSDYLHKIENASNSLLTIIEDILDISKIEAGKLSIEQREFCLGELLAQVSQLVTIEVARKEISFSISVDAETPICLLGDSHRLLQVLVNLVNNAVKFTAEGSVTIHVSGQKGKDDTVPLTISVKDSGIGISKEKQAVLFDAFSQADSSTTRKYGGTGLGLSICKNLVELMGGEITVESVEGEGSCFSLTVPVGINNDKNESSDMDEVTEYSSLEGISVLVAEDHHINQQVIKEFLEGYNASVTIVNNGIEAVGAVENNSYDIILMDIQMPEMDGYETSETIRKKSAYENIPIIAMTAHAMPVHIEKCKEHGMNDHIAKPLNPQLLQMTIGKWVHRSLKDSEITPLKDGKDDFHELYGVDLSHGLSLLRGKKDKYHALLRNFHEDFSGMIRNITEKSEKSEEHSLEKRLHTLAGCAGNVGAFTVSKLAQTAEKSLRNGDSDIDLSELREELSKVLKGIKELPAVSVQEKTELNDSSGGSERPVMEILTFVQLQAEKRSFSLSDDIQALKPYYQQEIEHLYISLETAVESFNFEEAHSLVTEMINSHN